VSGKAARKTIAANPVCAGVLRPVVDLLDDVAQMPLGMKMIRHCKAFASMPGPFGA